MTYLGIVLSGIAIWAVTEPWSVGMWVRRFQCGLHASTDINAAMRRNLKGVQ